MVNRTRLAIVLATVLALAGLATAGTWALSRSAGWRSGSGPGSGAGMMNGSGPGTGMMDGPAMGGGGYALPGDGQRVASLSAARQRAQAFADRLGLRVGEVIRFSNGAYAELLDADGRGATEVLVDLNDGSVRLETGPATMWNTDYGMRRNADAAATVSPSDALAVAQRWLDRQRPGLRVEQAQEFPGYYTLETMHDGTVVGMMSVHAVTGAVWYHTWHGSFVDSSEE